VDGQELILAAISDETPVRRYGGDIGRTASSPAAHWNRTWHGVATFRKFELPLFLAGGHVPDAGLVIEVPDDQRPAVGREGGARDRFVVGGQSLAFVARGQVEQTDRFVIVKFRHGRTVVGDGERGEAEVRRVDASAFFAGVHIPEPQCLVETRRNERAAIAGDPQRAYGLLVAVKPDAWFAGLGIP
jgi:hypothetical protein